MFYLATTFPNVSAGDQKVFPQCFSRRLKKKFSAVFWLALFNILVFKRGQKPSSRNQVFKISGFFMNGFLVIGSAVQSR